MDQLYSGSLVYGDTRQWSELRPLSDVSFSGLEASFLSYRTNVHPYGQRSVGLESYGGVDFSGLVAPLYSYHLRVSRRDYLVRAGRLLPETESSDLQWLGGTWLYGGELMSHFGHAMSESSHRLHPLLSRQISTFGESGGLDGVVFSSRSDTLKSFMSALLFDYYGISPEQVRLVANSTVSVERLVHVPQASILGGARCLPGYLELLQVFQERNRAKHSGLKTADSLFLSRRHLTTGGGQVANEAEIAKILGDRGFVEFKPELYSLTEQLAMIAAAKRIVLIGGSAVHLFEHLGNVSADVMLIGRGDRDAFYHPRPLAQRCNSLVSIEPEVELGDKVDTVTIDGDSSDRPSSLVTYDRERLEAFLIGWLS